MTTTNRQVVLVSPLTGAPRADNFAVVDGAMPTVTRGAFLARHIYLSLDPFQRIAIAGRHMSAEGALAERQVPSAPTVSEVIESRHEGFEVGAYVVHQGGWQEYSLSDGTGALKIDPARAPLSSYLGVLGMPGLTAYASIVKLANVKSGQTVLVSAASGPVGATLGQIALHKGAKAIGIAGSQEKCAYVVGELGFADCINYKKDGYRDALKKACGDGVDVYHDNVGGQILADAIGVLKNYGTVILCGLISRYNDPSKDKGLDLGPVIVKRAVLKGLVVYDFEKDYGEFLDLVAPLVESGKVKFKEDRVEGLENTPSHFAKLMRGENFGKTIVRLGGEAA